MATITRMEQDIDGSGPPKLKMVCECDSYTATVNIMMALIELKWRPQCELIRREGPAQVKVTHFESVFRLIQWPVYRPTEFFRIIIHTKSQEESDLLTSIINRLQGD